MFPIHDTLGRVVRTLADGVAGLAAAGIIFTVLLQIAARMFSVPVLWTEEATRFLFVWMIFLGLAGGFRTVESARVTVLIAKVPSIFRYLSVPIYVAASTLFFVVMGWTGWRLVQQQVAMRETAATISIPVSVVGLIVPISAILAIAAIANSLIHRRRLIALPEVAPLSAEIAAVQAAVVNQSGGGK